MKQEVITEAMKDQSAIVTNRLPGHINNSCLGLSIHLHEIIRIGVFVDQSISWRARIDAVDLHQDDASVDHAKQSD